MTLNTFETLVLIAILVIAAVFLGQGLKSELAKVTQANGQKIERVRL